MKKLLLTLSLIIGLGAVNFAQTGTEPATTEQPNPNAPEITFESELIDYGTIPHRANGERFFTFTNTGKEPLVISSCKGSCGCTVPTCPKEPIQPGQSAQIKVKYDTSRRGAFSKQVTIISNAKSSPKIVRIKGNVLPPPPPEPTEAPASGN